MRNSQFLVISSGHILSRDTGVAVEMWGYLNRGFGYALNSDLIAEEYVAGALLDVRIVFLQVPTGFEK